MNSKNAYTERSVSLVHLPEIKLWEVLMTISGWVDEQSTMKGIKTSTSSAFVCV